MNHMILGFNDDDSEGLSQPEEIKCDHCGAVIEPGHERHYKGLVICDACLDEAININ